MIAGYRFAAQIAATEPFRSLIVEQVRPNPQRDRLRYRNLFARSARRSIIRPAPVVWARISARSLTVTCVIAVSRALRVADASVMPATPSPNIHPATIMIAEKGSDIIGHSLMH
jgi:choline dehydrogenase